MESGEGAAPAGMRTRLRQPVWLSRMPSGQVRGPGGARVAVEWGLAAKATRSEDSARRAASTAGGLPVLATLPSFSFCQMPGWM